MFSNGIIVKCYQGIVCRRVHYAGLTVRGTGPNITAIRLSEEAPLLTNRQIALYNGTPRWQSGQMQRIANP